MINCIIVDDEPLAVEVIQTFVERMPQLRCMASCKDAFEAMEVLQKAQIQLMFLDINMPGWSGISLLRSLRQPPLVIFTTADPSYAVEGFELEAVDYLVKPISFERFVRAVQKAEQLLRKEPSTSPFISLKADKKLHQIAVENILIVEAIGDYVKVFTEEQCIVSKVSLKKMTEKLGSKHFLRIHKSFICALSHIEYVEGNRVKIHDRMLPIGKFYKEQLMQRLTTR